MATELQLREIQKHAVAGNLRITQHAHVEMVAEFINLADVVEAIGSDGAQILEDYPTHRRGPCCLLVGWTTDGRPLHVVCTTGRPVPIIITVYEPKPPRWTTAMQRGHQV